jgi:hypothetical protein
MSKRADNNPEFYKPRQTRIRAGGDCRHGITLGADNGKFRCANANPLFMCKMCGFSENQRQCIMFEEKIEGSAFASMNQSVGQS